MGGVDPEVRYSEAYPRRSVSFDNKLPAGGQPDDSQVEGASEAKPDAPVEGAPEAKPGAPVQPDSEAVSEDEVAASATTTRQDRNVTLGCDD